MKITLEQFCRQWDDPHLMRTKIELNTLDFLKRARVVAKDHFRSSFNKKRFAGGTTPWPARTSRWGKKENTGHELMVESGGLRMSFQDVGGFDKHFRFSKGSHGKFISVARASAGFRTNEISKRTNTKSVGFAAVHNTDPTLGLYNRNGRSKLAPIQRQFIGFSPVLKSKFDSMIMPMIFKDIPKTSP